MKRSRFSMKIRAFSAVITVVFVSFSISQHSFGQMEASPAGTSGAQLVREDIKQPLPRPGNVTVNFKDVEIKTVLHYLSEVSNVDIIPSPGVEGTVTMRLRDKPWEVALDIVTRNYGFTSSREGDIIRVIPKGQLQSEEPVTEVITLNNLVREIELTKDDATDSITVEQKEESILQLMRAINSIIDAGRGERATFIPSVNAIVVTAIPARVSQIKEMVAKIDKKTPQIILDCRVIEITLGDDDRFGIDWNAVITAAGARRPITFPFNNIGVMPWFPGFQRDYYARAGSVGGAISDPNISTTIPTIDVQTLADPLAAAADNALFSFGTLDFSTFTATLRMIQNWDDAEVLSSPRITTLDNQKATIKVVDKIMMQKTEQTTQTAGIVTVTFEKEGDAREVGVKLTVIPHVNEDGDISVNLLPEVSNNAAGTNNGFQVIQTAAATSITALRFSSREANTIVRVRDGETIFLGGLIRKTVIKEDNRLPILGDLLGGIPILGNVVKYERETTERTEIIFFVTVHIVKDGADSIREMTSVSEYNRYVLPEKALAARYKQEAARREVRLKTGRIKETEEVVEVNVPLSPAEKAEKRKKTYKPFLDFREKNKKEEEQEAGGKK